MAKLGKKARKFARKNLQSVLRQKRKFKAMRESSRRKRSSNKEEPVEGHDKVTINRPREGNVNGSNANGAFAGKFLDALFGEDDDNLVEGVSDSDGFLSEDPDCPYISENEHDDEFEGGSGHAAVATKNGEIYQELSKQKKKMDRLREKDPNFSKFLENHGDNLKEFRIAETLSYDINYHMWSSDEERGVNEKDVAVAGEDLKPLQKKTLTTYTLDVWCWMVMEQPNTSALPNLLNAFRAACHYGIGLSDELLQAAITNKDVYSKILTFMLCEADGIFRRLLGISDSSCKESFFKFKSTPEWSTVRPLIKSYLRTSLFLLNQLTDNQIITFTLSKLRASILFFSAFPSLMGRFIKAAIHFWATGDESLSLSSFIIMRDIATELSSDYLETCLTKAYSAFIAHCKYIEQTNLKHREFLSDSLVELYSVDVQQSYQNILAAVQQLANILQCALRTKKKDELQRIHSWQYINCLDIWVKFISQNIRVHDLQPLLYLVIQIITGVAHLFPGQRYLPLRIKCVEMLNQLSHASGVFIPVVSLMLDSLECKGSSSRDTRLGTAYNLPSLLKVPKQLLKSQEFQEECVLSALKQLSAHFVQWSYNISFPELATIPLIVLKRFHDKATAERLRLLVRRLIEQVERNSDFVQRKRDEVAFSPDDQASIESFLQVDTDLQQCGIGPMFNFNLRPCSVMGRRN